MGNILSCIDFIRKINNHKAFGITSPLITNADGSKMGKTADGAIWLDEKNYLIMIFSVLRNTDDRNVSKFLSVY